MGLIDPQQAAGHPDRHRLTQHLGIFPEEMMIQPHETGPFSVEEEDRFLLCSDGLTEMLAEEEIAAHLSETADLGRAADLLYGEALRRGGKDNITVLLVENKTIDIRIDGKMSKIRFDFSLILNFKKSPGFGARKKASQREAFFLSQKITAKHFRSR